MLRIGGAELFGEGGVRMVSCGSACALVVACNGSVWCTHNLLFQVQAVVTRPNAPGSRGPFLLPRSLFGDEDVVIASATDTHNGVITRSGRLYTCFSHTQNLNTGGIGYDLEGNMAYGNWFPRLVPLDAFQDVAVGRWHPLTPKRTEAFVMGRYGKFAAAGGATAYSEEKFSDEVL